jgi:predicted MFS family arabinose efflux permease
MRGLTERPENRIAIGVGAVCAVAGILLLALAPGFTSGIAAAMLIGLSAIAFVSLAFLIVGQSEERDRRRRGG